MRLREVLRTNHVDIAVHDVGGDEQGFVLVFLLGVEVKNFLDSIRAVIGGYHLVSLAFEANSFGDFVPDTTSELLVLLGWELLEVVGHEEGLLEGSEP